MSTLLQKIATRLAGASVRLSPSAEAALCPMPWRHIVLNQEGVALPCCVFGGLLLDQYRPHNIYQDTLDGIWNSAAMRNLRRAMVQGRPVDGCRGCFDTEKAGGTSLRAKARLEHDQRVREGRCAPLKQVVMTSARRDFRCATAPESMELFPSSTCNLRCRMCNSMWSTSIRHDRVQREWNPQAVGWLPDFSGGKPWPRRPELVRERLLRDHASLRELKMLGGETMLVPEIGDIVRHLVEVGAARHVSLTLVTNATTVRPSWLELLPQFERTTLVLSLDGVGPIYEYIRHPARWDAVVANARHMRCLPNVRLQAQITVQNYNALNLVELFRFCDREGLSISAHPLFLPVYLQATNMPPRARQLAGDRVQAYVGSDCRPEHRASLQSLVTWLRGAPDVFDRDAFNTFMLYTNDLDISRGQSFRDVHRELFDLAAEAGFRWTEETRFAKATAAPSRPET